MKNLLLNNQERSCSDEFLKELTDKILKNSFSKLRLPIDPFFIARKFGVEIKFHHHDLYRPDTYYISKDSTHGDLIDCSVCESAYKKRYAFACALGHHFLNHSTSTCHLKTYSSQLNKSTLEDKQVHAFAMHLLMPDEKMMILMKYLNTTKEISEKFEVEEQWVKEKINHFSNSRSLKMKI